MITFRDTTYCSSDCLNTSCERNELNEKRDRERLPSLDEVPTAWCDFSHDCPDYVNPSQTPQEHSE